MMFSVLRDQPVEYISLHDPAVDDASLSIEQIKEYVTTRDRSLLPIRAGQTPITWVLYPLDSYTLRYALASSPTLPEGGIMPDLLAYHLVAVGLKEARDLPEDAPKLTLHKTGMVTKVADEFITRIPPEVAQELAAVVYSISTVSEDTKKKSSLPLDEAKSKKGSAVKAARRE